MAELKRKVDNAQAAMMELTQENQSLQVWLKKKRQISLDSISIEWREVLFWLEAIRVKRGKSCNRCQARENMQPVFCVGKHGTRVKRGKTCNRCQARENMQPVFCVGKQSAGKHATVVKRGKICNRCSAWENVEPVPCVIKHRTRGLIGGLITPIVKLH